MTAWISGVVVVAVLALLVAVPGLWSRACGKEARKTLPRPPEVVRDAATAPAGKQLGRSDVARALRDLAKAPPPPTKIHGAMCYKPMATPRDQVRYVCPTDGTVVTFPADDAQQARDAAELRRRLPALRARGLDARLDEAALCPVCRRDRKPAPTELALLIRFAGEPAEQRIEGVRPADVTLLVELLSGEGVHKLAGPDTEPLRNWLPRLRELVEAHGQANSRAELARRLAALPATTTQPLAMGAMCYDMAPPPQTNDYICPIDGQRTHYTKGKNANLLSRELGALRAAVKRIDQLDVRLDESELCRHCKPDAKDAAIVLIVRYPDGSEQRTRGVSAEDVGLLADFLAGETLHKGPTGTQTLLKVHDQRLRELLGLPR